MPVENARIQCRSVSIQTAEPVLNIKRPATNPQHGDVITPALSSSQGVVNKDRAYRKLLLRSAPFRTLTSSEINRHIEAKRSQFPVNDIPVAKVKEGTVSRSLRRNQTIAEMNRVRHNYENYSHYRRTNMLINGMSGNMTKDGSSNETLPFIADKDDRLLMTSSREMYSDKISSEVSHIVSKMHVTLTETGRPKTSYHPTRRRDVVTPSSRLNGYELRGNSFSASKLPKCAIHETSIEHSHVTPERTPIIQNNVPIKKRPLCMVTFSAEAITNGKQIDNTSIKSGAGLAKPGKIIKKTRNIIPRPGTYGAYPPHGSTTIVRYFGNNAELDKLTHVKTLGQSSRPEQDTFTFRKVLPSGDSRWCSSAPQNTLSTLGLTEKNLGMFDRMRRDEQACVVQSSSSQKYVSSRIINWVKDRQVHLDLPIDERNEHEQDPEKEKLPSGSGSCSQTDDERQETE